MTGSALFGLAGPRKNLFVDKVALPKTRMPLLGAPHQKVCITFVHMVVNQNPVLSRAPPPHPLLHALCRSLLLHTFVANDWCRYALQKDLIAKVLVENQGILLQTYEAKWPPKPVTNPRILTHSHISYSLGLNS